MLLYNCNISHYLQNMKQLLRTPEVVVDTGTMLKIPIEREKLPDNKGIITPKKVILKMFTIRIIATIRTMFNIRICLQSVSLFL